MSKSKVNIAVQVPLQISKRNSSRHEACRQFRQHSTVTSHHTTDTTSFVHDISEPQPSSQPRSPVIPRMETLNSAKPFSSFLTDTFNRQHDYLRISITEKCNLRCLYCMPEEGVPLSPKKHILTPAEIFYLSSLFVSQGVTKIRLTGGEPTVHPQILPMLRDIGSLRKRGLRELALTTNGLTLARKLDAMAEAGVTGINLSLDTLDPFQFEIMTRRRGFDQVMKSINRILEMNQAGARIKLKVNAVVIRGLNDAQIIPFVEMTKDKDLEIRFIEYMPFDGNRWSSQKMLGYQEMLAIIREKYPDVSKVQDHPNDTSKTFRIPGFAGRIGFITSMTDHFCGSCNRLRITSDGNLKVCLFGNAEVSLRDMLRHNFNNGEPIDEVAWEAMKQIEMDRHEGRIAGDLGMQQKEQELLDLIGMAVKRKKAKHAGIGNLEHMKNRPMILIDHATRNLASDYSLRPSTTQTSQRLKQHTPARSRMPTHLLSTLPTHPSIRLFSTSLAPNSKPKSTIPSPPPSSFSTSTASPTSKPRLTHLTSTGTAHMVSLAPPFPSSNPPLSPTQTQDPASRAPTKPPTHRLAIARATISFSNATPAHLIRNSLLKKGDVLAVARIAGIMAAKRTAELVPLCHNIPLGGVEVDVEVVDGDGDIDNTDTNVQGQTTKSTPSPPAANEPTGPHGGVVITARVHCFGQTGVEMEALTAASVAGLTVYDMCKAVDRGMRMQGVRVVLKEGGKSGTWREGERVGEEGDL